MMKKSKEKRAAAPNWVAAGKHASWPLSPTKEKGFEGFVGFVNKQLNSSTINNSTI
ncbi:MAG: hypothetical protein IJK78_13880 [Bacteroidales bacterium]|nr:hypothetical protein [Bacteroidales bacterium]